MRLRPLALGEIYNTPPNFLDHAFGQVFNIPSSPTPTRPWDKNEYLFEAFRGGFPEARRLENEMDQRSWHKDYILALIERDLKDIAHIKRKDALAKLIEVMAAWSSQFIDVASICRNFSLSRPTIESYINALEALYLIERLRPWHKTDYGRVGKREKLFMIDTGMMAAILRWQHANVRLDGDMNGKFLETFVFNQLSAHLDTQENIYEMTHYRDNEQREIDFVIERQDGAILGIEVKAASLVNASAFKHLLWFQKKILGQKNLLASFSTQGSNLVSFGPNLWAVPMSTLWG